MRRTALLVLVLLSAALGPGAASALADADLVASMTGSPDPLLAGENLTYTITATNTGPASASDALLSDMLPSGTTFVSLSSPGGWTCTTPAVGGGGPVTCSASSFLAGGTGTFTLVVAVDTSSSDGATLTNTADVASGDLDPDPTNNAETVTTTVSNLADVYAQITASANPVTAGEQETYTLTAGNNGSNSASSASMSVTLPPGTTFASLTQQSGAVWSCSTPAVGGTGTVSCTKASFPTGTAQFTLVVGVGTAAVGSMSTTMTTSSATSDPDATNDSATSTVTVAPSADVYTTITGSPDPVTAGENLTYAVRVGNNGPNAASAVTLTDAIPTGTTFVSLSAPAGWSCTLPSVGAGGTVTCAKTSSLPAGAAADFTLVVRADPATVETTSIGNTASVSSSTSDPAPGNETSAKVTLVHAAARPEPIKTSDPLVPASLQPAPPPVVRALICGRVPTLLRHSVTGGRWILARDSCRVVLKRTGRLRSHKRRNRITRQSVRPGTPLYAGDVLVVRIN
jgi:uncharacterized repeat protein (TIGR01451 family)